MSSIALFIITLTACLLCMSATSGLFLHTLTGSLLTALFISGATAWLRSPWRMAAQWAAGWMVVVCCLMDCFCQEYFACSITPQILRNIHLSNPTEAQDFFTTFVDINVLSHWRITALLMLALALPAILWWLRNKPLRCGRRSRIVGMIFLSTCAIYEAPAAYRFAQLFTQREDLQSMEGLIFRRYHEQAPTPLHRYAFASYALHCSSLQLSQLKEATLKADIDSCSHLSPHIVLIIGESYNKHHSTLYGYPKPTTPTQQHRRDEGELMVFTDVVTPWNITSNVFLSLFSLWEQDTEAPLGEYPLFPILFRRAGYVVNFISNQYVNHGFRKGSTNQAGHFFLANKELSEALFDRRNRRTKRFDMPLLRQVGRYHHQQQDKPYTLDIIHLVGQHFAYEHRYPHSEAVFSEDDYAHHSLDDEGRRTVMHYDNATLYDDNVLDSILHLYEHDEAIVLFVADHGEEVYDEQPVHGRLFQEPTPAIARQEYEVPMWIWCSPSYHERHPDIVSDIRGALHRPFLTDGIPQILLHLADISCTWRRDDRDLLSPRYESKPRIISGCANYDHLASQK